MATNFPIIQVGRQGIASGLTTANSLTLPTTAGGINPTHAIIQVGSGNSVRWRADGTAPTTTTGVLVAASGTIEFMDGTLNYRSILQNFKVITTSGTDSSLEVAYFAI